MEVRNDRQTCPSDDIAAYLDGELSAATAAEFEAHFANCSACGDELRHQRQLLCTLDAAFSSASRIALPHNFTRVVAAHAENDMRGLRQKSERHRALQLSAVIAIMAFALLGAASSALVFQPARAVLRIIARALDLLWQTVADTTEAIAILARVIGRATIESPHGIGVLVALVFVVAISLLPRLIAKYHRTQIIE